MFGFIKKFGKEAANGAKDKAKEVIGTEIIYNNFRYMKDSVDVLRGKTEQDQQQKRIKNFDEYMRVNKISEKELQKSYKNLAITFYIMFIAAFVCLLLAASSAFKTGMPMILGQLLPSLAMCFFISCCMVKWGLMAYQLKNRKFAKLDEYLKSKQFFPSLKFK